MKPETIIVEWKEIKETDLVHGHTAIKGLEGWVHAAVVTRDNGSNNHHQEPFFNQEGNPTNEGLVFKQR